MKAELKKTGKEFAKVLQEMRLTEAGAARATSRPTCAGRSSGAAGHRRGAQAAVRRQQGAVRRQHGPRPAYPADAGAQATPRRSRRRRRSCSVKQQIEPRSRPAWPSCPPTATTWPGKRPAPAADRRGVRRRGHGEVGLPVEGAGRRRRLVPALGHHGRAVRPGRLRPEALQMSDVVQTQFGLHLILLTDRKNGQDVEVRGRQGRRARAVYRPAARGNRRPDAAALADRITPAPVVPSARPQPCAAASR